MNLSVVITHYKTPELLMLCLDSIKNTVRNIDYETIVVDSKSDGKTKSFIEIRHPDTNFICFEENVGYAKLVNSGLKKAIGDFLLILNADIILKENAVKEMMDYMEENSDIGIVGPQLLDFTNNVQASCFANPDWGSILARRSFLGKLKWGKDKLKKFAISGWAKDSIKEVDWVQGSAMMTKREFVEKIGLFDERFFMYFEDADWCRRFWQAGHKVVYLPTAQMYHYYHRVSKKLGLVLDILFNKYTRIHIASSIKYFRKYNANKK